MMGEKQLYSIEIRFSVHGTIEEVTKLAQQVAILISNRPEIIGDAEVTTISEDQFGIDKDEFEEEEDSRTTLVSETRKPK